jgi:hypothetical protein
MWHTNETLRNARNFLVWLIRIEARLTCRSLPYGPNPPAVFSVCCVLVWSLGDNCIRRILLKDSLILLMLG